MNKAKLLPLLVLVFFGTSSLAQTQESHKKKVHVDENGRVYWNRTLPVYIHLSPDPTDKSKTYRLKSEGWKEYADPYRFDTEGVNYIRTRWATDENGNWVQPKTEVLWEVWADSEPPITKIDYSPKKPILRDNLWYLGNDSKVFLFPLLLLELLHW